MRRRSTALLLAALAAVSLAGAAPPPQAAAPPQETSPRDDPTRLAELVRKRLVYTVPGMERVKVRKDVVYKRVAGEDLLADFYLAAGARRGDRRPAVVFIHGGRVSEKLLVKPKDWGAYVSFGQLVAASGFVAVTFNHRFYTMHGLDEPESDIADLIAYVRDHADSLGVDRDRIVLWAVSAGGLYLAQTLREPPPHVRCLVAYYPVLELLREDAPDSVTDEVLRAHSPVAQVATASSAVPPLFLARAGLDDPLLNASIDRFVQGALAKNLTLDLANHPQGHHGFDIQDDDDRSREILRRTLDFIRTHA